MPWISHWRRPPRNRCPFLAFKRGTGHPRVVGVESDIGAFGLEADVIFANGFDGFNQPANESGGGDTNGTETAFPVITRDRARRGNAFILPRHGIACRAEPDPLDIEPDDRT